MDQGGMEQMPIEEPAPEGIPWHHHHHLHYEGAVQPQIQYVEVPVPTADGAATDAATATDDMAADTTADTADTTTDTATTGWWFPEYNYYDPYSYSDGLFDRPGFGGYGQMGWGGPGGLGGYGSWGSFGGWGHGL
jgi:hypothetical protein